LKDVTSGQRTLLSEQNVPTSTNVPQAE